MIDRTIAPEIHEIDSIRLKEPEILQLSNKTTCFLWHSSKNDLLKIDLVFPAGSIAQEKPMTAYFTSKLIKDACAEYSSKEIADIIDFYGAFIEFQTTKDEMHATLLCLPKHFKILIKLLASIVYSPLFLEDELIDLKKIERSNLSISLEKVDFLSAISFNENVFGNTHPYGWNPNQQAIENVQIKDIQEFHRKNILNKIPDIYIAGNYSEENINEIGNLFGNHIVDSKSTSPTHSFSPSKKSKHLNIKEAAVQSSIRIGCKTINKEHPDSIDLYFTTILFGGYFGSRLMKKIREEKGYTYGVGAMYQTLKDTGALIIATQVKTDVTDACIDDIFYEMERLKSENISDEEIKTVTSYITGSLLKGFDGVFNLTDQYKKMRLHGLNFSYYYSLIEKINQINSKKINNISEQYFNRNNIKTIISGNLSC